MISHKFLGFLAAIAAGLFAVTGTVDAMSRAEQDVQDLANFSKLVGLENSRDSRAPGKYFSRVALIYRAAGYPRTATAFSRAGALGRLGTSSSTFLPRAKSALRRVRTAVNKEDYVRLPAATGQRIPHYHRLAETFVRKADRALKNVAAGRDVLTGLRKAPRPAWVTFQPASNGGTLVLEGGSQWRSSAVTLTGVIIERASPVEIADLSELSVSSTSNGSVTSVQVGYVSGSTASYEWTLLDGEATLSGAIGTLQIVNGILQRVAISSEEQSDDSTPAPAAD